MCEVTKYTSHNYYISFFLLLCTNIILFILLSKLFYFSGWRSVERDLESQLVLVTTNEKLRSALGAELEHLSKHTALVNDDTFTHPSRYVKYWVRMVVPVIKKFF